MTDAVRTQGGTLPTGLSREAQLGMWVFLASEVLFFGGLLLAYLVYRSQFPQVFREAGDHLHMLLGAANTAILLTSSLSVALADRAAELGKLVRLRALLAVTAVLGALFLAVKLYEWSKEHAAGLVPLHGFRFTYPGEQPERAEMFFNLYFAMTGLHALHLLIGIVLVVVLLWQAPRASVARVRVTGLYWHFVDLVWVFLFPILYLIR